MSDLSVTLVEKDLDTTYGVRGDDMVGAGAVTVMLGGVKYDDTSPDRFDGDWAAQLYGSEKNTDLPTGVAGAFHATVGEVAAVAGSFAATK